MKATELTWLGRISDLRPAQTDDANQCVTERCWLRCGRESARVLRGGSARSPGITGPCVRMRTVSSVPLGSDCRLADGEGHEGWGDPGGCRPARQVGTRAAVKTTSPHLTAALDPAREPCVSAGGRPNRSSVQYPCESRAAPTPVFARDPRGREDGTDALPAPPDSRSAGEGLPAPGPALSPVRRGRDNHLMAFHGRAAHP